MDKSHTYKRTQKVNEQERATVVEKGRGDEERMQRVKWTRGKENGIFLDECTYIYWTNSMTTGQLGKWTCHPLSIPTNFHDWGVESLSCALQRAKEQESESFHGIKEVSCVRFFFPGHSASVYFRTRIYERDKCYIWEKNTRTLLQIVFFLCSFFFLSLHPFTMEFGR